MTIATTLAKVTNPILDPVFGFMLKLPPSWAIILISLIITLVVTIIYKKATDQELMKTLKQDMKAIQKEIKELGYQHPKTKILQKQTMELSMKQMKESFKPMIWTMIPILILFGWFATHLAYYPILPMEEFTTTMSFNSYVENNITMVVPEGVEIIGDSIMPIEKIMKDGMFGDKYIGTAQFTLKGEKGTYLLEYQVGKQSYFKEVIITNEKLYAEPLELVNDKVTGLKTINIDNKPIKLFGLSWFWAYIICSLVFNMALRKILKIH